MSEIGAGGGSGYPAAIDTRQTYANVPISIPDSNKRVDAELANDITDAILKIEAELGINPSGGSATVAARFAAGVTPNAHAATHQNAGSDEINVAGLSGLLADDQNPTPHAADHQNGGADEISVLGLSGLLADPQTPLAHAASHQNGGLDEISVAGLSGLLADPQTPIAHSHPESAIVFSGAGHEHTGGLGGNPIPTAGIEDDAVIYAKMQNVSAASRLLGRGSGAGAGDVEEITLGSGLSMAGTVLSATGSGPNYPTTVEVYSDFLGQVAGSLVADTVEEPFSVGSVGVGTDVINVVPPDLTSYGVLQLETGTTATGRAEVGSDFISPPNRAIPLGTGIAIFEARVRIPILSTAGQRYIVDCGFMNDIPGPDRVIFRYSDNVNGGDWQGSAATDGTESTLDTNIVVAANTWYKLRIEINAAGTSVAFFIDGVSVGTIVTNIPTGGGNSLGYGITILKTVGTTERVLLADYEFLRITPTTTR